MNGRRKAWIEAMPSFLHSIFVNFTNFTNGETMLEVTTANRIPCSNRVELNYVCMVLMIAVSFENGIALVTLSEPPGWLFCMQITLEQGEKLAFEEEVYVLRFSSQADFDSTVLNLYYSSLAKPGTWIAYNMITGKRAIKKVTKVLQGFDPEAYVTVRVWASSHDGVKVCCSPLVISFWALDQLHCRINSAEHSRILRA
jgi:hypothetical protein